MKGIIIAGLGAALLSSSTYAQQTQVVGQPMLRAPAPMAPEDLRSHPNFGQPATKLPRAARAPSTPESRSAAALALSADKTKSMPSRRSSEASSCLIRAATGTLSARRVCGPMLPFASRPWRS